MYLIYHVHIHMYMHIHIRMCIYIYIQKRERERERERGRNLKEKVWRTDSSRLWHDFRVGLLEHVVCL